MDPLSVAASVVNLITFCVDVGSYLASVKNAPKSAETLRPSFVTATCFGGARCVLARRECQRKKIRKDFCIGPKHGGLQMPSCASIKEA